MSEEKKPTRYMLRKFENDIGDGGCEFWTGEDGEPVSFVVKRNEDGLRVLREWLRSHDYGFEARRLKEKFAYRERTRREEWGSLGAVWRVGDEPTPFPVYEYQYY